MNFFPPFLSRLVSWPSAAQEKRSDFLHCFFRLSWSFFPPSSLSSAMRSSCSWTLDNPFMAVQEVFSTKRRMVKHVWKDHQPSYPDDRFWSHLFIASSNSLEYAAKTMTSKKTRICDALSSSRVFSFRRLIGSSRKHENPIISYPYARVLWLRLICFAHQMH